jgi:hypothetical protein
VAVDPAAARGRRRQVAGREHGVWLRPGPEPGTSRLSAVLPVGHGAAVMDAITTLAADPRLDVGEMCHGGSNVLT